MLGLQLTYNLRQDWYLSQMPGNLIASLNQRMNILSKLKNKCGLSQFKLLCYNSSPVEVLDFELGPALPLDLDVLDWTLEI